MRRGLLWALILVGCGEEPRAVVLRFPNAEARAVIRRLQVQIVENETVPRTCAEGFLGTAALGREAAEGERRVLDERCAEVDVEPCAPDWADGIGLSGLAARDALVYVRGFASVAEEAPVILEGCSTRFGPEAGPSTEIELQFVLPSSTRLERITPPRLVVDVDAPTELRFALRADNPALQQGARRTYGLPAVDVAVEVASGDGTLQPGDGAALRLRTDAQGEVELSFRAASAGPSRVQARLSANVSAAVSLTALPPLSLSRLRRVSLSGEPVGLALRPDPPAGPTRPSVLVLGCAGEGRCHLPERLPENEVLGRSELFVVDDLMDPGAEPRRVAEDLGRLPVDVVGVEGGAAVASARSRDCLPVSCPTEGACRCEDPSGEACACERSELTLLREEMGSWRIEARHLSTASTAAALAVVPGPTTRLAVAYRGRIGSSPSCASACDCPFGERCRADSGLCEDRDQEVEILEVDGGGSGLFDGARCGCLAEEASCGPPVPSEAACMGIRLAPPIEDECGRVGPAWVPSGPLFTPSFPLDLGFGPVRFDDTDMVVGGLGRVELVTGRDWAWDHRESRFVNDRLDAIALGQLDPRLDLVAGEAGQLDLAFWSGTPCGDAACPRFGGSDGGAGCFGVLTTAGPEDAFSVPVDDPVHCRRRDLEVPARGGCLADVDGDGALDAVTAGGSSLLVFRGDAAGGLADPGTQVTLEGEAVAVACRDLDGDQASEVLVLLQAEPALEVWSAAP